MFKAPLTRTSSLVVLPLKNLNSIQSNPCAVNQIQSNTRFEWLNSSRIGLTSQFKRFIIYRCHQLITYKLAICTLNKCSFGGTRFSTSRDTHIMLKYLPIIQFLNSHNFTLLFFYFAPLFLQLFHPKTKIHLY